MRNEFRISAETGALRIGDAILLQPDDTKREIEAQVAPWLAGARDYGNGHEWLDLRGLTFGGRPASIALGLCNARLEQASWSVGLPNAPTESGWPTREAIDGEVAFVCETLAREMGISTGRMSWGELWSQFDAKAFIAANGLRYRRA